MLHDLMVITELGLNTSLKRGAPVKRGPWPIAIATVLALSLTIGGCSGASEGASSTGSPEAASSNMPPPQGDHPKPGSAPTGTSATFAAPSTTTSSPTAPFPPRGILVSLKDAGGLNIYDTGRYVLGLVNPDTLYASVYRNFRILKASGIETYGMGTIGGYAGAVGEQGEAFFQISPDGRRLAASLRDSSGSEAGWITEDGTFTAASPNGGVRKGPLGESKVVHYRGEGFDNTGNFYYTERHGTNELDGQVWVLSTGETDVTKARQLGDWSTLDLLKRTTVRRDGTVFESDSETDSYTKSRSGIVTYGPFRCADWLNYQISIQGPGDSSARGLLPDNNEVCVTSPVSSPDGSQVAFLAYPNESIDGTINVVPTNGGPPRALSIKPPPGMVISGLISWN